MPERKRTKAMGISVPKETKAQMEAHPSVNWSEVAAKAFHAKLIEIEEEKDNSLVDRLRTVKLEGKSPFTSVSGLHSLQEQFSSIAHECDSSAHEVASLAMKWAAERIHNLEAKVTALTYGDKYDV